MPNLTDWSAMRRLAHNGRYLFCSTARLDEPRGAWLRRFYQEAAGHRASVEVRAGHVYVLFRLDHDWQVSS